MRSIRYISATAVAFSVLAASAHAYTPPQVAERAAVTMMNGQGFAHGQMLDTYIAKHGSRRYHVLVRDCDDPALASLIPPYLVKRFGDRNIADLDCGGNVRSSLKMPRPHDYRMLGRRAFYGIWHAVDKAAGSYHVQKRFLKIADANGARVVLKYACHHLHGMLEVRMNYNEHGFPVVTTRSCDARGHDHYHRARF